MVVVCFLCCGFTGLHAIGDLRRAHQETEGARAGVKPFGFFPEVGCVDHGGGFPVGQAANTFV